MRLYQGVSFTILCFTPAVSATVTKSEVSAYTSGSQTAAHAPLAVLEVPLGGLQDDSGNFCTNEIYGDSVIVAKKNEFHIF